MARWLGIDLSATTVRVALVSSSYRKLGIEALREESVADHPSVVAAIRAATVGLRPDACAAGLEGRKTFTRKLDLPRAALRTSTMCSPSRSRRPCPSSSTTP